VSRENKDSALMCESCGTMLLINERFKLTRPIRGLNTTDEVEIFEALDLTGSYDSPPNQIKVLKILKSGSSPRREIFRRGAEISMSLVHQSIPRVDIDDFFEITIEGQRNNLLCLAMDKIEGSTLTEWIKAHGKISQRTAIAWMQQVAEILDYIHHEGILHRDIKPDNIMVRPSEDLVLIDFDSARRMTNTYRAKLSYSDQPMTTIISGIYTAPEQLELKPVPQSDFYSLGMSFIYALTGCHPSDIPRKETTRQLLWHRLNKSLDPPFVKFIDNLIHPSITRRPSSSIELVNILVVALPQKIRQFKLYRSKTFRVACAAIAVLLGTGVFYFLREQLAEYYLSQASQLIKGNRPMAAQEKIEAAIKIRPTVEAYNNLGYVCDQLSESQCALDSFNNAIKLNPRNWESYYNLGSHFEKQISNKESKVEYQEILSQAESAYQSAVDNSQGKSVEALNNLSRISNIRGNYPKGEQIARDGLQQPSLGSYYKALLQKNLGWAYLGQKKYPEARIMLQASTILPVKLISSHCLLALTSKAQNRINEEESKNCLFKNGEDFSNPEIQEWRDQISKSFVFK
jgi:serine/threonine protein kinase